ncbi:hypothetical protein IAU59_003369 [Kwoniella sp. CBS 9459]
MERLTRTLERIGALGWDVQAGAGAGTGHWKRMEAHASTTEDSNDILERNATAFHAVLAVALSLITLICFYALYRGSQRPFLPSCLRRNKHELRHKQSRSRRGSVVSSDNALGRAASRSTIHVDNVSIPSGSTLGGGGLALAGGPGGSGSSSGMWAGSIPSPNLLTDGAKEKKGMWRKTAYLTDLKRAEEALRGHYQDQRNDVKHQLQYQPQHQQYQQQSYGRGVASTDVSREKISGEWGYFAQHPQSYLQSTSFASDTNPSANTAGNDLSGSGGLGGLPLITSQIPSPTFLHPQTSSPSYPYIVENRLSSGIRSATASLAQTSMDISRGTPASKSAVSLPLSQYSNIDAVTSFSRKSTSSTGVNRITYPPGAAPPITPDQASVINKLESRSSYDLLRPLEQAAARNVATGPSDNSSSSIPLSLSIPPSISASVSLPQAQSQAYHHSPTQVINDRQVPVEEHPRWAGLGNASAPDIRLPEPTYEAGRTRTRTGERTISMGSIAFPQPEPYSATPSTRQFSLTQADSEGQGQGQQRSSGSPQSASSENRYSNLFAYAMLNDMHADVDEQGPHDGDGNGDVHEVYEPEPNVPQAGSHRPMIPASPNNSILRPAPFPIQPQGRSPAHNPTSPSSSKPSISPSACPMFARSRSSSPLGAGGSNDSAVVEGDSKPFPFGRHAAPTTTSDVGIAPATSASPPLAQLQPQHRQPSSSSHSPQAQSYSRPPRKSAQYSMKSPRPSTSSLTPSKLRYSLTIASSSPPATSASRRFEDMDGYLSPPRASMSGFGRRSGSVDSRRGGPPRIDFIDHGLGERESRLSIGRPPSTYGYAM